MTKINPADFSNEIYFAEAGDITYEDSGLYFCLQTKNDINNVLVYAKNPVKISSLTQAILSFIALIYNKYNIRFISLYMERDWTSFIKRNKLFVLKDNDKQYYADIELNIGRINEILERRK